MKVFQSLNCVVCKLPFARKANEARSPRHLDCGSAMCHECFEKERQLKKEERKHQCVQGDDCFDNLRFAFYLIDVLSQEDSLTLSPLSDGYLLVKPFKIPECPICHDEYSNQVDGKKSFSLYCNHLICTECYLKNRTPNTDVKKQEYLHQFTCPICNKGTLSKGDALVDRFQALLNELPMMTHEMEGRRNPRVCGDCKETRSIDEMYHCNECDLKICPGCAFEGHRSHETTRLLEKALCEMSEAQQEDTANEVKTYNDLFAGMHENILKDLEALGTKLTLKEENCKSISTFGEAKKTLEKCAKLREDFKSISEKHIPHLRQYEKEVKELTKAIDKDDYQGLEGRFEE